MIEEKVIELIRQVQQVTKQPTVIEPATDQEINALERAHELTLPDETKAWFKQCNGVSIIPPRELYGLFPKGNIICSIDWYFKEYPEWKKNGWIPIASDGCGDVYVLATAIKIPSTGTHPVFFLDQADFSRPAYIVASGLWKFLYFLLEDEILTRQRKDTYWPFDKKKVIISDPQIIECREVSLPWEAKE